LIEDAVEASPAAPMRIFVMGENRWREEADWPLARAREARWFLHSAGDAADGAGELSLDPPHAEPHDTYVYDPRGPGAHNRRAYLATGKIPAYQLRPARSAAA
jgi:uncharacterized protein